MTDKEIMNPICKFKSKINNIAEDITYVLFKKNKNNYLIMWVAGDAVCQESIPKKEFSKNVKSGMFKIL